MFRIIFKEQVSGNTSMLANLMYLFYIIQMYGLLCTFVFLVDEITTETSFNGFRNMQRIFTISWLNDLCFRAIVVMKVMRVRDLVLVMLLLFSMLEAKKLRKKLKLPHHKKPKINHDVKGKTRSFY